MTDWIAIAAPVAREMLGEPTTNTQTELRFGRRGSLSVQLGKGVWFDHETSEGGGVIELVKRERSCSRGEALAYTRPLCGHAPHCLMVKIDRICGLT